MASWKDRNSETCMGCVYAPVNVGSEKGKEDMKKFWNYVNECLMDIGRGSIIVLIGDMNGRIVNKEMVGVAGKGEYRGMASQTLHFVLFGCLL